MNIHHLEVVENNQNDYENHWSHHILHVPQDIQTSPWFIYSSSPTLPPKRRFLLLTTTKNFIKPTKVRCTFGLPDWRLQECTMYRWLPKQPVVKVQHLGWWKLSSESIGTMLSQRSLICLFSGSPDQWDSKTPFMGMIYGVAWITCVCSLKYVCLFFFRSYISEMKLIISSKLRPSSTMYTIKNQVLLKVLHHHIHIISWNIYAYLLGFHFETSLKGQQCRPETWWGVLFLCRFVGCGRQTSPKVTVAFQGQWSPQSEPLFTWRKAPKARMKGSMVTAVAVFEVRIRPHEKPRLMGNKQKKHAIYNLQVFGYIYVIHE